ncbi:PQQ-dependent oxidoreductase, gdhB family [Nitrincola lacisaponensis]|uniref:PQQ-dependent oxidoreductase, gdhB family n=1 Tax=Nitrincola lacisaponensis TaxID=267850 RepID=A0A063Y0U6_9GAMM|nr:PQQ-dependent sugar dehydrogenase [Nitrincola lacisaponensis]KDE39314.1 PQQ-dependent oxidoreductase, gdhB family [Nitrincola lacisaponensis]
MRIPMVRLLLVGVLTCCAQSSWAGLQFQTEHYRVGIEIVADGLSHPWSIAFLPTGEQLVTERDGRLRLIQEGRLHPDPIAGVPQVAAVGQGGLLDIVLHPEFEQNRWVYLSYSDQTDEGLTTRVMRARFEDHALVDTELLFEALPRASGGRHFGGRMVFDSDGYLYLSVGDRGEMEKAQDGLDHAGSIIRLHDDGRIPEDNPFTGDSSVLDEIYTLGNRNPQGMALHPQTGEVWSNEHGPRGGDEVNRIQAGLNYGWPEVTHGINYSGSRITEHTELPGMESPLLDWTPSIAPSGMVFYTGDEFPSWRGQILNGALRDRLISRVSITELQGEYQLQEEERMLQGFAQRIRDIRQSPEGEIWLLTDQSPGQVVRLRPVTD